MLEKKGPSVCDAGPLKANFNILSTHNSAPAFQPQVSTALSPEPVSRQLDAKPRRGGRPEGGIRRAARELGLDETEIRRALKIAGITPEGKAATMEAGLDDNQSALLKVAAKATAEEQAAEAWAIARGKQEVRRRPDDVALCFAHWALTRLPEESIPTLLSFLDEIHPRSAAGFAGGLRDERA
jgi:hypothetical protein